MTEVTASELKMLYIEIIIVSVAGIFMLLYNQSPIGQNIATSDAIAYNVSVGTSNSPWSTTLVDSTLGLPIGVSAIIIVSSIFLIPLTIMNALTLLRVVKDLATQWI